MFLFKTWMKTLDWTRQCFSTKHIVCFPTEHYKNSLIWKVLINEISIFLWKTLYETLSHSSQCFITCFDQKHRPMPAVICISIAHKSNHLPPSRKMSTTDWPTFQSGSIPFNLMWESMENTALGPLRFPIKDQSSLFKATPDPSVCNCRSPCHLGASTAYPIQEPGSFVLPWIADWMAIRIEFEQPRHKPLKRWTVCASPPSRQHRFVIGALPYQTIQVNAKQGDQDTH